MWFLAGVDDFLASSITVSASVIQAVQKYGPDAVTAVKKYGPRAAEIITRYGAAAVPYIQRYGRQAIELIAKHGLSTAISMLKSMGTAPATTPGQAFASMGSSKTVLIVGAAAVLAVLLLRR